MARRFSILNRNPAVLRALGPCGDSSSSWLPHPHGFFVLKRDRHRCVISSRFDDAEAPKRVEREGDDEAKDDKGHKLKREAGTFTPLEVAHILPHSLMNVGGGGTELVCTFMLEFILLLVSEPDRFFRMTPRKPP